MNFKIHQNRGNLNFLRKFHPPPNKAPLFQNKIYDISYIAINHTYLLCSKPQNKRDTNFGISVSN